jgi:glycerate kinase
MAETLGIVVRSAPGGGAAGGLGAGLLAFCRAELKRGIDVVLDATGFDARAASADLLITGEGRIDSQFRFGKALAGVLERGKGKPVLAVVGAISGSRSEFTGPDGFSDMEVLVNTYTPLETAMTNAASLVRLRTIEMLQRILSHH